MSGRCRACDKVLNDFEMTRKYPSGEYLDLCNHCYSFIKDEIDVIERADLREYEDWDEDEITQNGEVS